MAEYDDILPKGQTVAVEDTETLYDDIQPKGTAVSPIGNTDGLYDDIEPKGQAPIDFNPVSTAEPAKPFQFIRTAGAGLPKALLGAGAGGAQMASDVANVELDRAKLDYREKLVDAVQTLRDIDPSFKDFKPSQLEAIDFGAIRPVNANEGLLGLGGEAIGIETDQLSDDQVRAINSLGEGKSASERGRIREVLKKFEDFSRARDSLNQIEGVAPIIAEEGADIADTFNKAGEMVSEDYGVDPEYANTFMGQLADATGRAPAYVMMALSGAGTPLLLATGYDEAIKDYRQEVGDENYDSRQALSFAMPSAISNTVLERLGIEAAFEKIIPAGAKLKALDVVKRLTTGGVSEGVTEVGQDFVRDLIASGTFDDEREIFTLDKLKERANSFLIGTIVGTGTTGVTQGAGALVERSRAQSDGLYDDINPKDAQQTDTVEATEVAQEDAGEVLINQTPLPANTEVEGAQTQPSLIEEFQETLQAEETETDLPVVAERELTELEADRPIATEAEIQSLENMDEESSFLTRREQTLANRDLQEEVELQQFIDEANAELRENIDIELTPAESQLLEFNLRESMNRLARVDSSVTPVTQINAEKKKLTELAKRERAVLNEKNKGDRKSANLQNRLSKAQAKIEEIVTRNEDKIKSLKERLDSRLQQEKVRSAKRLANEVKRRVDAVNKRFRERADLQLSIKNLEALVKELPVQIRGKFSGFGAMTNLVSQEAQQNFLNRASERILNLLDDFEVKQNKNALVSLVKRASKNKKAPKELAQFKGIKRILQMDRDDAEAKANQILGEENISPEMAEMAFLLKTFGGKGVARETAGFTGEEMRLARQEAEFILREGRSRIADRIEREKSRKDFLISNTLDEVLGGSELKGNEVLKFNEQNRSVFKRVLRGINEYAFERNDGLETLLDNLRVSGDRFTGFFQDYIFTPVFNAQRNVERRNTRDTNNVGMAIRDIVSEQTGITSRGKLLNLINSWGEKQFVEGINYKHQGKTQNVPMSKWEAISMWMQWQDTTLASTFEAMEIDQDTIDSVESYIGSEGIEIAKYLMTQYEGKGIELRRVVADVDNYILPLVENYSPISRIVNGNVDTDSQQLTDMNSFRGVTEKNRSLIERVNNTNELAFLPANEVFAQHAYQMNHYVEFARVAKDLRTIFGNEAVKRAIRQRTGGTEYQKLINTIIDDILRGGIDRAKYDKFFNAIISNLAVSKLAFNLTSAVKQLGSIPAYANEMPAAQMVKYIAKFWLNPVANSRTLIDTDYIQNRISNSYDRDLRELSRRSANQGIAGVRNLRDRMMFLTRYGDLGAILQGGWALYQYTYDQQIAQGKTEQEAKATATKRFEQSTDRAQQSSQTFAQGYWQRGGSFVKLFTMFMTTPIQYQRIINNSIRSYATKKDGQRRITKRQLAKTVFIYHVLLPQIFTAMGSAFIGLWSDDDEVIEKFWDRQMSALLVGNLNSIFIGGAAIQGFIGALMEDDKDFLTEQSIPVLDALSDLGGGARQFAKGVDEGSDELVKGADKLMSGILSLGGMPYDPIKNQINGIYQVTDGDTDQPLLKLMGFSDYAIFEEKD